MENDIKKNQLKEIKGKKKHIRSVAKLVKPMNQVASMPNL